METKRRGGERGNAIENETREIDPIEEIIRRNAAPQVEPEVTEEDATLAEEHRDGGAPVRKKY
jgi:hypothetical protein